MTRPFAACLGVSVVSGTPFKWLVQRSVCIVCNHEQVRLRHVRASEASQDVVQMERFLILRFFAS